MYYSISMHMYALQVLEKGKNKRERAGLVRDSVEKRKKREPLNHGSIREKTATSE